MSQEMSEKAVSAETAKEILQAEKEARIAECAKELDALLKKHRCTLDPSFILKANQIIPQIGIIALE